MVETRIATAVILTRGSGAELELFLARRAPELRFFGGYVAFLGGVVDAVDHDGDPDCETAALRCAWRELFEEVGVLPPALAAIIEPEERAGLRTRLMSLEGQAVHAALEFRAYLERCPALIRRHSACAPQVLGRLTTPPFAPVLYRTRFVRIELPLGEEPEIINGELVQGEFVTAKALLQRWRLGQELIVPPVVRFLALLAAYPESEAWRRIAEDCEACCRGKLPEIQNVPGIWMLPLATDTIPPATTTNAYWIGSESAYLVDPASFDPLEQARLFDFVDARLEQGLCLKGVIATHHHHDHVGAILPVALRYGVPVLAHGLTLARLDLAGAETRELKDGDELLLGTRPDAQDRTPEPGEAAWSMRVFHTPGHDQGHIVLLENSHHAALVGDLCSTVSTIVIDPPEGHMATYLQSLERMLRVPMGVLHPAHGPVHRDGHRLLREYLAHRAQREQRLWQALGARPLLPSELVDDVYDALLPGIRPLAERSLLAGLQKLEEEGRVCELPEGWLRR